MESGRERFRRHKRAIAVLIKIANVFPLNFRVKSFEHFRMTRGMKGILFRYVLMKTIAKSCGDNVSIHPGVYFINVQNLELGDNVSIHPMCYIDATGGMQIGNNVSIAHSVTLLSTKHTWENRNAPIKYNKIRREKTCINDDVWIGCGSRVLAGVTVCSRSIVAAGAVVTNKVYSDTIVGGIPAKVVKRIGED